MSNPFCKEILNLHGVPVKPYKQLPGEHAQEFASRIFNRHPPEDEFWALKRLMDFSPPTIAMSPARDQDPAFPINPNDCYKCGENGHFAKHCSNPRNRDIQPRKKNKRQRKALKRMKQG
ncbi:unnamed protein product [Orchesella dallaii]|uniref:CCHC-type domain-containing protein n=1 Tax=Orchesella dallaii TaxID=48710 RepID=A0ABP1Q1B2_9HEXA